MYILVCIISIQYKYTSINTYDTYDSYMCIHVCTYLNVNHPTYNLAPTSLHPSKARVGCWAPEPWRLWFQQSWPQPADDAAPPNMPRRGNDHQDGLNDVWSILDLWVEDLKLKLHFPEERWPEEGWRSFFVFFRTGWLDAQEVQTSL